MSSANTAVLDWDGTLQTDAWPGWGEWMPGAVEAMHALHGEGVHLMVASVRLSPYKYHSWPVRQERDPYEVAEEKAIMRDKLDEEGLTFVDIWDGQGKPPGGVYVDDKGLWYPGRPNSWNKLTPIILMKLGKKVDSEHL